MGTPIPKVYGPAGIEEDARDFHSLKSEERTLMEEYCEAEWTLTGEYLEEWTLIG